MKTKKIILSTLFIIIIFNLIISTQSFAEETIDLEFDLKSTCPGAQTILTIKNTSSLTGKVNITVTNGETETKSLWIENGIEPEKISIKPTNIGTMKVEINGELSTTKGKDIMVSKSIEITVRDFQKGDINLDARITVADAICALKNMTKKITLTEKQIQLGDINNNGKIDISDPIKILKFVTKKIDSLE